MKKHKKIYLTKLSFSLNKNGSRTKVKRALLITLVLTGSIAAVAATGNLFRGGLPLAQTSQIQDQTVDNQTISATAAAQILALIEEKKSRTPTERKIDSQLLYASKMQRGEAIAAGVQSLSVNVGETERGSVVVDISGTISDALLRTLEASGARVLVALPAYGSVRAEVALDQVETIAASPDVRYIQSKQEAMTSRAERATTSADFRLGSRRLLRDDFVTRAARVRDRLTSTLATYQSEDGPADGGAGTSVGARQSQGDITHRANVARSRYGVDGTGVKIGVLSDGVINLSFAQASGDLPPDVTVLPGQAGLGDEGTAMLEIVHDLAPGAQLFFATAFTGITSFADNIRALRAAGCDIIVDDVFYFAEAVFQDGQTAGIISNTNGGVVTQAVNDVTADGAHYFSSAGNEGNLNDGTAGVFEGDFTNGGLIIIPTPTPTPLPTPLPTPVTVLAHDFDPSPTVSQFNRITLGSGNPITLTWADPLGASNNDYDLYILNTTGTTIVAASTGSQSGTQDPFELVGGGANVTNNRIVVAKFSGADRFLHVNTFRGRLLFATAGQTHGHASAAAAYAVAATPAVGPFPQPFTSANVVETFESDGPRKLYFQPDGTAYTPGNFLAAGGITRQKPDITAADGGVVSGAGGFSNPFFGTSAAAPHAAAIAALVADAVPGINAAQLRTALNASAIDIEAPGVDRDSGVGIIMADTAIAAAGGVAVQLEVSGVTATEVSGNGNGFVEPGERATLSIQLQNNTADPLTNITGTLTSNTPGVVVIPPGTAAWPDIGPGLATTNTTPFQFIVSSSVPNPSTISFTLTVNVTGAASPQVFNINVNLGRAVTINTTLDAAAPPTGEGFTSITGLQSGRLVRTATGSNSSCGIVKSNPGINAADAGVPHRFDAYRFTNSTDLSICVTITLTTSLAQAGLLQSAAYAPTFIPTQVNANYLGDIAGNGPATRTYSVIVPANTTFVIVVNEVTGGSPAVPYTLTVDGLPTATAVPPLVSLQFSQATIQTPEACSGLNLTVTRTGDTSLPVSVDFATSDVTASSRKDYTKALGSVQFAAGQTNATITMLISEDSHVEGDETFNVTLSNPQGTEVFVGSTPTITVTIQDDVVEPTTNVIDDTTTFVCQHYHDFLNREPDAGGLAFWVNNIESCGANASCRETKRIDTSAAFFLSIEFQESSYFVYRVYHAAFGRRVAGTVPVTFDEFLRDTQKIQLGVIIGQPGAFELLEAHKQAYALEFVKRAEFKAEFPESLNAAQFVDGLNANTGGLLSLAERNALIAELAANNTDVGRASVLRKVVDNAAFIAAEFNRAFVLAQYFGYLRRDPNASPDSDFAGFNFWLDKLNEFNGDFRRAEMVKAFILSIEYRQRFGQ